MPKFARPIPWAEPRTAAIFVGILDLAMVIAPAVTYLFSYMFWQDGMLDRVDPLEVIMDPNDSDSPRDMVFILLYYFPPAGFALMIGLLILMATYMESLVLMIVIVGLNMILIFGSIAIIFLMICYFIKWFLILPLLIPTVMQIYYLWILTDYREHLFEQRNEAKNGGGDEEKNEDGEGAGDDDDNEDEEKAEDGDGEEGEEEGGGDAEENEDGGDENKKQEQS